jgi:hypothetical protein
MRTAFSVGRVLSCCLLACGALTAQGAEKKAGTGEAPRWDAVPPLDVAKAVPAAVTALLALQEGNDKDQWPYEGVYHDADGIPFGYRVGGTAIACSALIDTPGYASDAARTGAVARGVDFVLHNLEAPQMQKGFSGRYDVRGWGHIYALELFLELLDRHLAPAGTAAALAMKIPWLVDCLVDAAIPEAGGWNYSLPLGYHNNRNRASTFMTSPALQVLFHAAARGHAVPDRVLDEALAALERGRTGPGGYAYGVPGGKGLNDVGEDKLGMMDSTPGSSARRTAVESTLLLAGHGDQKRLAAAVDAFFTHWDALEVRRKRLGTHIKPYGIAPYYFLYGHRYCAQAIELLDDETLKVKERARLLQYLARTREEDGSWDDRQFPRSAGYGTAFALMCMLAPQAQRPVARPVGETKDGGKKNKRDGDSKGG